MGARQVLRAALVAALLLATRSAFAAPVATGVLDLRAPDADPAQYDAVLAAVRARPGVAMTAKKWETALVGEPDLAYAEKLRDHAIKTFGEQGCADAVGPLREAILAFLMVADPDAVADRLQRPLELLDQCAGAAPTHAPISVSITSEPTGARVFVGLALAGVTPLDVVNTGADEWLVVHHPGRLRSITKVPNTSTHLVLGAAPASQLLEERVAAWRAAGHQASAADITTIMRDAQLEVLVVLPPAGEAQIWALGAKAAAAKAAGTASVDDPQAVAEAASGAVALLAPAGELPPDGLPPEPKPAKKARSPWIYAGVAGAVLLGAGLLYLTQSGGDTQRLEITFP